MYTKHHTRGIVLGGYDRSETDRMYVLLTSDFGKIYARAHGVRRPSARHKSALQTLSKASVSLVRGKTGWRITNVTPDRSLYVDHASDTERLAALVRVLKLANRLVAGEGKSHGIFSILESFADALTASTLPATHRMLEMLAVLRMLRELGYIDATEQIGPFVADTTDFSQALLDELRPHRKTVLASVNHALEASQL